MSELKWNWVYYPYLDAPNKQEESALKAGYIKVVIKSEADKVIAEKDKEIADLIEKNKRLANKDIIMASETIKDLFKELRHSNYKRCLAMAKWCRMHDEFIQLESERLGLPQSTLFLEYRRKAMWWNKWRKRWLELAEKFKEGV